MFHAHLAFSTEKATRGTATFCMELPTAFWVWDITTARCVPPSTETTDTQPARKAQSLWIPHTRQICHTLPQEIERLFRAWGLISSRSRHSTKAGEILSVVTE